MSFFINHNSINYVFFFLFCFLITTNIIAQKDSKLILQRQYFVQIIDSLEKEFSTNKTIIKKNKLQILTALSYYPELKENIIVFKEKEISTTMVSRPTPSLLFRKRKRRIYTIIFNNKKDFEGVFFDELSFNAQIGIIGHELAHIVDYKNRNSLNIIALGIKYFFHSTRIKLEHKIDKIVIKHGLGWQIFDFSNYVLNYSNASAEYKKYKRKIYFKPEEIKKMILD